MGTALQSSSVAFLAAAEGTEQVELIQPWQALLGEGGQPVLVSPASGEIQMFNHLDKADTMPVDVPAASARQEDYAGLVLPGGVANPDQLRTDTDSVAFARSFFEAGKPVAVICHGPWTLVEAGVLRDRTLTSWPSLRTDIRNAGGNWVDEQVVLCEKGPNVLVSSRNPQDLPAFCTALIKVFGHDIH
ncbi:MAG TPA: type 1 glutamine amidotransferase domain-containing protein [Streptosporangiaceae bacterium]|jgi:protease I|nr:type 1 glutamine amidotransferase domain-containing protein [Streptosporangiaceae bacterium]